MKTLLRILINCDISHRFARFFIDPLLSSEATNREMNAVDAGVISLSNIEIHLGSEHAKNLQSDLWRFDQLTKSTCNPKHPYHKFQTGDLQTLNVTPKTVGMDTHEKMVEFFNTYYSSNIMKLVVLGRGIMSCSFLSVTMLCRASRNIRKLGAGKFSSSSQQKCICPILWY